MLIPFKLETPSTPGRKASTADTSGRNTVSIGRDRGESKRLTVPAQLALSVRAELGHALNMLLAIVERGSSRHRVISRWAPATGKQRYGGIGRSAEAEAAGKGFTYLYPGFEFDGAPVYESGDGASFATVDDGVTVSGSALIANLWLGNGYRYQDDGGETVYVNGLDTYIGVVNAALPGLGMSVSNTGDGEIIVSFAQSFKKGGAHVFDRIKTLKGMLASDAHPAVGKFLEELEDSLVDQANARAASVVAPEGDEPDGDDGEIEPDAR